MEKREDVLFLSDEISECFNCIVNESLRQYSYEEMLEKLPFYFLNSSDTAYDEIFERFPHVNKKNIFEMVLADFLEVTYYRKKIGISLDRNREQLYGLLLFTFQNPNSTLSISSKDLTLLFNDVFMYKNHLSPLYVKHVQQNIQEKEILTVLDFFYPLTSLSHLLAKASSSTLKEEIYYTMVESISDSIVYLAFSKSKFASPFFLPGYIENAVKILSELDEKKLSRNKVYHSILFDMKSRIDLKVGDDEKKISILEFVLAGIYQKDHSRRTSFENKMVQTLVSNRMTTNFLSSFYDENQEFILTAFLFNFTQSTSESQLQNLDIFDDVCYRNGKQYRK